MNNGEKMRLVIGVTLIVSAGLVWWAGIAWWQTRIPKDWHFKAEYLGNVAWADAAGKLPTKRSINKYVRERTVLEWHPDRVLIKERYSTYNINTGKIDYEVIPQFELDPKTGKHLRYSINPEMSGAYYLFPRDTAKQEYLIADYTQVVFPVRFIRETVIDDLTIYLFQYKGKLDLTAAYMGSSDYPGTIPPAGQRIISPNMLIQYWVEPISGHIVKMVEESPGDYFVDEKTGKQVAVLAVWAAQTTDSNTQYFIQKTKRELEIRGFVLWWIPGALLILGLAFTGHGLRGILGDMQSLPSQKTMALAISVLLILGAGLARWRAVAEWNVRIPKDWNFEVEFIGSEAPADQSGKFPEKRLVTLYKRSLFVKEWGPKRAIIEDIYTGYDAQTNAVTWEMKGVFIVDPATGRHIGHDTHPEAIGILYQFPRNSEEKAYTIFNHMYTNLPYRFDRKDVIDGLDVNVFHFAGDVYMDEIYQGTKAYPGFITPVGQRISGFYTTEVWVEPLTGGIIKQNENSTGDYFVDAKTRNKIAPVNFWGVKMAPKSVYQRVQDTKQQLRWMRIHQWGIPGGLLLLGLVLVFYGYRRKVEPL